MADYLPWTVPPFCKGRLGGIFYSLKDRLQHRLCLSQRLSVLETQDFQSLLLEIPRPLDVVFCLSEFHTALRRVRRPVLLPVYKNQRCSCRWVFAYRIARQEFVFAASGTIGVARRRSDLSARASFGLKSAVVGNIGKSPPTPLFLRGGQTPRTAFLSKFYPLDYTKRP